MSWDDIMRRVLPPSGGFAPHVTSRYGDTNMPSCSLTSASTCFKTAIP
jgi:hypothetical protein